MANKPKKLKLKTHKAAASRLHVTGSGKLLRMYGGRSHFRRRKPVSTKRKYEQKQKVSSFDTARLRALIPYSRS